MYDDGEGTEGTTWFSTTGEHIVRVKVEDNDGDVDSDDENRLLGIETVTPVPAISIAGLLLTALIILAIGVYGLDRRTGKQ